MEKGTEKNVRNRFLSFVTWSAEESDKVKNYRFLENCWMDSDENQASAELGTGPEKRVRIFLWDYQGDFHIIYVTFYGASEFSTFEAVSCTGHEKNRYFTPKKHINSNKKNITKTYQPIF